MTSIHLSSIGIGSHRLSVKGLEGAHQERLETAFKQFLTQKIVSEYFSTLKPKTHIDFTLRGKTIEIVPQGGGSKRRFKLENGALRDVSRVAEFYEHVGILPKSKTSQDEAALRMKTAKVAIKAINDATVPGSNEKARSMLNVSDGALSLGREIMSATPAIGPEHPLPHNLAFPVGAIWSYFAIREMREGWKDHKRAQEIGDGEGRRRAVGRVTTGSFATVGSGLFISEKVSHSAGALAAGAALGIAADVAFGIGAVIGMGLSSLGIHRCRKFKERLDGYYANPNYSKVDQVKGSLNFLQSLLIITDREKGELIDEIEAKFRKATFEEKNAIYEKKIAQLGEKKAKYLKRRTSNKCLELLFQKLDPLLAKLNDPATHADAIKEADLLIKEIRTETNWKMGLYILGLVASILSLVGMIIAQIMTAGMASFLVMATGSFIYLCIATYSVVLQLCRKSAEVGNDLGNLSLQVLESR